MLHRLFRFRPKFKVRQVLEWLGVLVVICLVLVVVNYLVFGRVPPMALLFEVPGTCGINWILTAICKKFTAKNEEIRELNRQLDEANYKGYCLAMNVRCLEQLHALTEGAAVKKLVPLIAQMRLDRDRVRTGLGTAFNKDQAAIRKNLEYVLAMAVGNNVEGLIGQALYQLTNPEQAPST